MKIVYRYILGLLVLLMLFSACANLKTHRWYRYTESRIDIPENFWLADSQKKILYKINIEAFHQKQSGLLMVKQADESSIRLLMVTEFGLKVFDVEYFKGDSLSLHYIMKHLDNPYITNALFDNMKVLYPGILTNISEEFLYNEKEKEFISRLESGKEQWDYFMTEDQKIYKIERLESGRKRALIQFDNQTKEILIKTKHPSISIRLKKIINAEE